MAGSHIMFVFQHKFWRQRATKFSNIILITSLYDSGLIPWNSLFSNVIPWNLGIL